MAVSSTTYPTRGTLRRVFRPLDAAVGAAILLLIFAVLRLGRSAAVSFTPSQLSSLDTSPLLLPYYAARSLLRMFIALFFAYAFSFAYAYAAARSRRARRVLIPALDILQSVPVLGFLSVTIVFFISLFPGSELGLEAASIFAVFTAQAWNITFSFYHSLVTEPTEFDEASRLLGLSRWKRFWTLDVPNGAIGLVWNGMMSFGGSWFFLTASEQISVANRSYTLPGVGSYVGVAAARGQLTNVLLAMLTMVVMVLAVNFLFWRPLTAYAERFRFEQSEAKDRQRSLVLDALRSSHWPALLGRARRSVARPVNLVMGTVTGTDDRSLTGHPARRRMGDAVFWALVIGGLGFGLYAMVAYIDSGPAGAGILAQALGLGLLTFLRVAALVVVASIIWVPVGVWIGFNPRVARFMQPVIQLLASFPANFLFPFAILVFIDLGVSLDWGGILLMALGTQWYILFNVIAGASAVPSDLREAMDNLRVDGWTRWRRLILPGIFPAYVTGAITASGGAWNASIVAETVTYNGRILNAHGLGAFITAATARGDYHAIFAGILMMCVYVVAVNTLFWRRLYRLAETRYALG
ncbi:MAG TPA: ABC transporter permease subunit [Candidatus Binatia bacterium]|nr:ABC transporter permease subunit [Candidatus Binatia bacterium]